MLNLWRMCNLASGMLRRTARHVVSVRAIAEACDLPQVALARRFRKHFGMSMRDYVALARLAEALRAIPHNKVETTAREAGFKSRKDFYRAFKRFTGMTPSEYRRLPRERAQQLLDEATLALDGARRQISVSSADA